MDNPEEILHSLEEFSKMKPKDIPRELEEYLCFVAKTGDPVYQWSSIKSLFREKLINVITEFYETCPTVEIPPCPNVELFNYDTMKNFILEKLDTFAAAPFTVQRICELLTTPRKEYNRIDKYMRALEKNILVVSTTEPGGNRRNAENGEGIVNGLESEHIDNSSTSNDINVEEMDDTPSWPRGLHSSATNYPNSDNTGIIIESQNQNSSQEIFVSESKISDSAPCSSSVDTVITCRTSDQPYVSIEPVASDSCSRQENVQDSDVTVTITAIPPTVQNQKNSEETVESSDPCTLEISESPQELDREQEVQSAKLEEVETSTLDENKEGADSTSQKHDSIEKELDEDSQVASTSSETTSSETSPESEESNIESERDYTTAPDKEMISAEVIASSEDISADTTKSKDELEEVTNVESSSATENTNSPKEAVISSSDEITSEPSTTENISTEIATPEEDVKSELAETQIDTNEHLDEVPEISISNSDSTSSSNQIMDVDISDDTTEDTAATAPNPEDSSL